jgi:tetratricopeptide (TPR) repeat protein
MKKIAILLFLFFLFIDGNSQQKNDISGIVQFSSGNLNNATVHNKSNLNGTVTDRKGRFSIKARIGDTLVFSFQGMKTIEKIISKKTISYNIYLIPEVEELNEVRVRKKIFHTQQELLEAYNSNKRLIKTYLGILDKDRASFSLRIIDGNDLITFGTDFLYSLQNLVPNMIVDRQGNPTDRVKVYLGSSRVTAIFDVDGFIYDNPPTFIQANEIDRIAILTRHGAYARYGPQGIGGVIVINTKSKNWMDEKGINRAYDNTALRDSIRTNLDQNKRYINKMPEYLNKFRASKSVKKANKLFKKYKPLYGNSPYYYLNISLYIKTKWGDSEAYLEVLKEMYTKFPNDIPALKALAYNYESNKLFKKSQEVYLHILKLRPVDTQSYINLANNYSQLGNYQQALKILKLYKLADSNLDTLKFDKFGVDALLFSQINYTQELYSRSFHFNKTLIENNMSTEETRLVFEWNDKSSEFEIEYTNNDINTSWSNYSDELLFSQKLKGYSSKQILLNNNLNPNWTFKVNYFGNRTPTYLKVTAYFNSKEQISIKKTKIFNLSTHPQYTHLFTLDSNSMRLW